MKKKSHVAKSYGEALFHLGQDEGINDDIERRLHEIVRLFETTDIDLFLQTPTIPRAEKLALAKQVFAKDHPYVLNFMRLLIERNRTNCLSDIASEFTKVRDRESHSLRATVRSRFALSEKELDKIRKRISKLSGQDVNLTVVEDSDIIGGIRLHIQDKLLDGTVSAQLDLLRRSLLDSLAAMS